MSTWVRFRNSITSAIVSTVNKDSIVEGGEFANAVKDTVALVSSIKKPEDVKDIWLMLSKTLIKEYNFSLVLTGVNHNKVFKRYGEITQIKPHGFHEFLGKTYTDTSDGCFILDSKYKTIKL